jgi:hypothetical protein
MSFHDDSKPAFERPTSRRSVLRAGLGLAEAVRRFLVSPALEGRRTMSVGRQWVRRLGLLLAASMVVQVPALVGVGVSGASAASPTPSYQATLSISNCVATVAATWSNAKVQSVYFQLNQFEPVNASTSGQTPVRGKSGTLSYVFNKLNPLPGSNNSFNAIVDFYGSGNSLLKQVHTNDAHAPCYLRLTPS